MVMNKFQQLSDNLVLILEQLVTNQNLCKYISVYQDNPLSQPDIANTSTLIRTKIFPFPFMFNAATNQTAQIHVYFPKVKITDRVVENVTIYFDIVCHKDLWLMKDNNNSAVRPYQIASEIAGLFDEQFIGTLGKLVFEGYEHYTINDTFQLIRLVPKMMNYAPANL